MIVSAPTIDLNFEKNRRLMISISHSHNFVTYYIMLGIREKQKSRPDSPRRQKSDNNRRHDEPGRYPGTAR